MNAETHTAGADRPIDPATGAKITRALEAVRRAPNDLSKRAELIELLVSVNRYDLAIRQLRKAIQSRPKNWQLRSALGEVLFRTGDFTAAERALGATLKLNPHDANALLNLSAILYQKGDEANARNCMIAAIQANPIMGPAQLDPAKPTIVRLRSIENSRYGIQFDSQGGIYHRRLRSGHFSVRHFLDKENFNIVIASIYGDNLLGRSDLPRFDLTINTISDPDRDPGALKAAVRFLDRFPAIPVINHPRGILETSRDANYRRLGSIDGVHFPRTSRFRNDAAPEAVAARLEADGFFYPMIVREAGSQTGITMVKADDRAALIAYLGDAANDAELYAIQFVDLPDAQGRYHKTRAFFIDGTFHPIANLTNDIWQIHSGDRYRVMSTDEATQEEERRYLSDPEAYLGEANLRRLHEIGRIIDLDFFGIDFTIDRDGGILIFEANAAMRHNYDHADAFPYTRPTLDRASAAFERMIDARLADWTPRPDPAQAGRP